MLPLAGRAAGNLGLNTGLEKLAAVNAPSMQSHDPGLFSDGVQSATLPLMRGVIVMKGSELLLLLLLGREETTAVNFFVVAGAGGLLSGEAEQHQETSGHQCVIL